MSGYRVFERGTGWRDSYSASLADPETLSSRPHARLLQESRLNQVVSVTIEGRELVLKLFDEAPLGRWIQSWVLGSAARRAARSARRMIQAGFTVPELVGVLEKRSLLGCRTSCLVTSFVSHPSLESVWQSLERRGRLRIAADLGEYVARLHRSGLYPQDLRAANVVADLQREGWAFVLVDLDRVRSYRSLSPRRKLKNLVQLYRSLGRKARRSEQARFLRSYLGDAGRKLRRRVAQAVITMGERKDREYEGRRAGDRHSGLGALWRAWWDREHR